MTPDIELFRDVFNASPIGIAVETLEGQPFFVNPAFCSMLGFSEEELRYKHCVDFSPPEDVQKDWALFQQLKAGFIDHYQLEKRYFRKDGSLVWGCLSISSMKSSPSPLVLAMVEDITDKKKAEEARFRHAAVIESSDDAIASGTLDGIIVSWNTGAQHLYGYTEAEAVGKPITMILPPELRDEEKKILETVRAGRHISQFETVRVAKTGKRINVSLTISPIKDSSGRMVGVSGIARDITERKRAEEALAEMNRTLVAQAASLQAREELLRVFVKNVPAAVAMLDRDMRYLQVSDRWCSDNSVEASELLGRSRELSPEMPDRWKEVNRRALQGETLRADEDRWESGGSTRWARWEVRPWRAAHGTVGGILILTEDITRRKQMEEALRESEDKLRLLLDSTAEAIYGVDLEHRCTFCNPACLRILGYERLDQVLGKNTHDLLHHSRADGTVFPVDECRVHRVTQTGEGVHVEDEVFWRANGTSFPVEYWSYPQRRGQELVGAVVAFVDITERKLAEAALANVSRKLIEAQEQERNRIGRELHDDIGQRLALLAVKLQQLQANSLILPDVRSCIGELKKQTSEIATDLQSLSHELHSAKLQYLGIAVAMRGFCREFGEQQKVDIDFQTNDLPSPVPPDIALCFFRVLQEALHNSAKHSGVRHFEVRLWGTSDGIHLTVADSGAGFDRETGMKSTGLGLTSMQERLRLVGGTLSIESRPRRGTTIYARVPFTSSRDSALAAG